MNPVTESTPDFGAVGIYILGVLAVLAVMLGVSYVLGQRHREKATGDPYESGILITGSARMRFSARFYLVAMLFVIFDLEAALIFSWAVAINGRADIRKNNSKAVNLFMNCPFTDKILSLKGFCENFFT